MTKYLHIPDQEYRLLLKCVKTRTNKEILGFDRHILLPLGSVCANLCCNIVSQSGIKIFSFCILFLNFHSSQACYKPLYSSTFSWNDSSWAKVNLFFSWKARFCRIQLIIVSNQKCLKNYYFLNYSFGKGWTLVLYYVVLLLWHSQKISALIIN